MSDDDKETSPTLDVAPIAVRGRVRHSGSFSKDNQPERGGRTAGSLNKITRTMKDAIIAAADELGRIKHKDWSKQLEGEPENGMKGFFKVLAVKELRTFGIILARMIPAQAHLMTSNVPTYLTEEQMHHFGTNDSSAGAPHDKQRADLSDRRTDAC